MVTALEGRRLFDLPPVSVPGVAGLHPAPWTEGSLWPLEGASGKIQGCPGGSQTVAMRPDATSPIPSTFSAIPEVERLCANDLAFAIFDPFPVSPGHVLVIPRYAGDMPDAAAI